MIRYPHTRWHVDNGVPYQERPFGLPLEMTQFDRTDISIVLTPNARALHDELQVTADAVPELIVTEMLGSTAAATQCEYDVEYLDLIKCPTSIFIIYVAGSGSRKSTVHEELTRAHCEFMERESAGPQDPYELEATLKLWAACEKAMLKEIEQNILDTTKWRELRDHYANLLRVKPGTVKTAANIMHKDVTYPALAESMASQSACTSWGNDDATSILPYLRRMTADINRLWDGAFLKRGRVTSGSAYQPEPRLSICWGMQPKRFAAYINENGADFVDVGMGARTMIAVCRVNKPNRNPRRVKVVRDARDRHYANLTGIFTRYAEAMRSNKIKRTTLTLAANAQAQFDATLKWLASNRDHGQYLAKIPEFANRIAENILRIASNLHVIEGRQGAEIELDILQSAILLMIFYTEQHIALFGDLNTPMEERHATIILKLLKNIFDEFEFDRVPFDNRAVNVRKIQQFVGSNEIRSKRTHVVDALMVLVRRRVVEPLYDSKGDLRAVTLNDNYFRQQCDVSLFG